MLSFSAIGTKVNRPLQVFSNLVIMVPRSFTFPLPANAGVPLFFCDYYFFPHGAEEKSKVFSKNFITSLPPPVRDAEVDLLSLWWSPVFLT